MSFSVILNWKSFVALGASVVCIIFALKMNSNQAEEVSLAAVEASKEVFIHKVNAD